MATLQNIVQVHEYASTDSCTDEKLNEFYELIIRQLNEHSHYFKVIMGDFNAKAEEEQQCETTIST